LLNRAGLGGPPARLAKLAAMGLEKAVEFMLAGEEATEGAPDPAWARPDPDRPERLRAMRQASAERRRELQREERRLQQERLAELRGWWLERMAKGPRPLQEKMVLFWHGHFATSMVKVRDAYLMWRQNDLFRRLGLGAWLDLLEAVSKDPAMLIWLDQAQSRKEHPNENYARELMELFTLGEGHYTERDVTEAARALTGLSLDRVRQEFAYRASQHDGGEKVVLGRSGRLGLKEVLEQILAQPQADRFIAGKLWTFFAGANPAPELVEPLAAEFRAAGREFRPFLRTMFCCQEFYADTVVRAQIKSPVQFLVMAVRQLERDLPPPAAAANALRLLGQDLFAPPNVKGWDGGAAWITTNNLLNRHNLATLLVLGENALPSAGRGPQRERPPAARRRHSAPVDVDRLVPASERGAPETVLAALERRFIQDKLRAKSADTLRRYLAAEGGQDDHSLLQAIRLTLCTPEYQLT
jgi:uncharacterized protein (DUF1800 family)